MMYWIEKCDYALSSNYRFRLVPVIDDDGPPVGYRVDEYAGCRWRSIHRAKSAGEAKRFVHNYVYGD